MLKIYIFFKNLNFRAPLYICHRGPKFWETALLSVWANANILRGQLVATDNKCCRRKAEAPSRRPAARSAWNWNLSSKAITWTCACRGPAVISFTDQFPCFGKTCLIDEHHCYASSALVQACKQHNTYRPQDGDLITRGNFVKNTPGHFHFSANRTKRCQTLLQTGPVQTEQIRSNCVPT
jgi:hypothetical protein